MTRYTLLLLKKNDTGAKQIHFGSLLIFFIFFVVIVAGSGMGYLFYDQNKKLISQQQVILEQETMQAGLQEESTCSMVEKQGSSFWKIMWKN